ncbi:MAG: hypothetical protein A3G25_20015 [Betaproteobacteria bacterium RIFCSPLOWO2_12_FULL_63_13]|nr:MAG: hypothetical protein A3H32_15860 [Betaproteobacteria bacterium RIFCSPLOWO2_02_FULL_63_19]OGA45027.1 MAG: hypothetical protein A3G25_20015 [Betaproteobacteria bacterium RIFCSPLOWO2_12_FULL_63_13]
MFTKTPYRLVGAGCLVAALLSAPAVSLGAEVIKFGMFTPPKTTLMVKGLIPFLEQVSKESEGAFKYKGFWGGSIMRNPAKQYEVLIAGLQDGAMILPSYTQALFPDFSLFALPNLFRSGEEASIAMWRLHEKGLLGGLDKMHVMAIFSNGNSAFHVSKKLVSVEDLKGLKIRSAGPEEADVIKAMGAVPVGMSINQVAEGVSRGVVDGTLSGWEAIRSFRIEPLIVSSVDMNFGTRSLMLVLNRKVYDRLPQQAKDALAKYEGEKLSRKIGKNYDDANEKVISRAIKNPKKNIVHGDKATLARVAKMFKPFHEAWIKAHKDGQKKYDALQQILAELRKGS